MWNLFSLFCVVIGKYRKTMKNKEEGVYMLNHTLYYRSRELYFSVFLWCRMLDFETATTTLLLSPDCTSSKTPATLYVNASLSYPTNITGTPSTILSADLYPSFQTLLRLRDVKNPGSFMSKYGDYDGCTISFMIHSLPCRPS